MVAMICIAEGGMWMAGHLPGEGRVANGVLLGPVNASSVQRGSLMQRTVSLPQNSRESETIRLVGDIVVRILPQTFTGSAISALPGHASFNPAHHQGGMQGNEGCRACIWRLWQQLILHEAPACPERGVLVCMQDSVTGEVRGQAVKAGSAGGRSPQPVGSAEQLQAAASVSFLTAALMGVALCFHSVLEVGPCTCHVHYAPSPYLSMDWKTLLAPCPPVGLVRPGRKVLDKSRGQPCKQSVLLGTPGTPRN